jgi:hypothetical protein
MPLLINPCTHLISCEPCCPSYDANMLADLDATVDMTLVVNTKDGLRRRFTYALPPKADAIFLTEDAKRLFLWPYVEAKHPTDAAWPRGYDPRKHPPLNSTVLLDL